MFQSNQIQVKGKCWSKNCFAHCSTHLFHCTFVMISMKKYGRTSKKALSICVKGTKMWNALSSDIKLSRNVNAFKKMLKALLLENYKF